MNETSSLNSHQKISQVCPWGTGNIAALITVSKPQPIHHIKANMAVYKSGLMDNRFIVFLQITFKM